MSRQKGSAGGVEAIDSDGEEPLLDVALVVAGTCGRCGPGELLD